MNPKRTIQVGSSEIPLRASMEEIRSVWALVSENPTISVRKICKETNMKIFRAQTILKFLERAGYIIHDPRCVGRTVVIPLITMKEGNDAHWNVMVG